MRLNFERGGAFLCKKWTLFSVCLILCIFYTFVILINVLAMALKPKRVDTYAQNSTFDAQNSTSEEHTDEVKV